MKQSRQRREGVKFFILAASVLLTVNNIQAQEELYPYGSATIQYCFCGTGGSKSWSATIDKSFTVNHIKVDSRFSSPTACDYGGVHYVKIKLNETIIYETPAQVVTHTDSRTYSADADIAYEVSAGDTLSYEWTYTNTACIGGVNYVTLYGADNSIFSWPLFLPAINSGAKDCNGVRQGDAYSDNCEKCVGGDTGLEPCAQDCSGRWGGTAVIDECGICDGLGRFCPVNSCVMIPQANIIVDGDIRDWQGVSPILVDGTGDGKYNQNGYYIDVKNLYLAMDQQYLYCRFEFTHDLQDNLNLDLNVAIGSLSLEGHFVDDALNNWVGVSQMNTGENKLFSRYPASYISKIGNNAEYKIPLSALSLDIEGQIFSAWIYITGEGEGDALNQGTTCPK